MGDLMEGESEEYRRGYAAGWAAALAIKAKHATARGRVFCDVATDVRISAAVFRQAGDVDRCTLSEDMLDLCDAVASMLEQEGLRISAPEEMPTA